MQKITLRKKFLLFFPSLIIFFIFMPLATAQINLISGFKGNTYLDEDYLYPVNSEPYGIPYNEWSQRWWEWILSIPIDKNPNYVNPERINMSINQDPNSNVFFLFQRNTDYQSITDGNNWTVTIPKGKAIFTQIASGLYDYGDPRTNPTLDQTIRPEIDNELKKVISSNNNAYIKVVLDGNLIFYIGPTDESKKFKYRTQTGFFDISLPENNMWDEIPGVYRAFAEGYYLMLKPLPVGTHKLLYEVSVNTNVNTYSQEMIFNLIVK